MLERRQPPFDRCLGRQRANRITAAIWTVTGRINRARMGIVRHRTIVPTRSERQQVGAARRLNPWCLGDRHTDEQHQQSVPRMRSHGKAMLCGACRQGTTLGHDTLPSSEWTEQGPRHEIRRGETPLKSPRHRSHRFLWPDGNVSPSVCGDAGQVKSASAGSPPAPTRWGGETPPMAKRIRGPIAGRTPSGRAAGSSASPWPGRNWPGGWPEQACGRARRSMAMRPHPPQSPITRRLSIRGSVC